MIVQLNSVVIDADAANRKEMAAFLAHLGVGVAGTAGGPEQLPQWLGMADSPQIAVVNLDPRPQETLAKLAPFVKQFPQTSFFVLSKVVEASLLMEAMHLGIRDFVPLPINEEKFAAGIERVAGQYGMGRRARVLNVVPTIGGVGATTVACNIAAALARNSRTVLVDLDLYRGAVASSFDLHPRYAISDLMDLTQKLDKQLLDNALAMHQPTKLAVLARPEMPEDALRVSGEGFGRLMNLLTRMFDHVVVDSTMSVGDVHATAIRMADVHLVVVQLNIPSVRNAERYLASLRRMGADPLKLQVVVNRYVKKGSDITPEEVEKALGVKISWLVPNDFKSVIDAINFGEPVVIRSPRAEISASLNGLADLLGRRAA